MPRTKGSLLRATCCACKAVVLSSSMAPYFRCIACKESGREHPACEERGTGKQTAQRVVARAIREGRLTSPRGMRCVDCDGAAGEYEHRDYNQPLSVEPICRGCNLRRGPAVPLAGSVERLLARGAVPYRSLRAFRLLCSTLGQPSLADGLPKRLTVDHWQSLWPLLMNRVSSTRETATGAAGGLPHVAAATSGAYSTTPGNVSPGERVRGALFLR